MRKGLSTSEAGKLGSEAAANTIRNNKLKRIEDYNSNPKLCKNCNLVIEYDKRRNDFCSHSCSVSFNNKGVRRHGDAPIDCLNCGIKTHNEKFCSAQCQQDILWKQRKDEMISSGKDNSAENRLGKRYLIELHKGKCQICSLNEWMGKPMPLVLDHINGNPYDNSLTNLRVICHNCNAQTPTFAGRNKGNGRVERAKRYKEEKKIFDAIKQADIV